jgi:hypothetical protein
MEVGLDDLANDPSLFLHGIDFQARRARFFRIEPGLPNDACDRVRQKPPIFIPLDILLDQTSELVARTTTPIHFIWMTDYCGSTLFARALNEVPGLYLYNETLLFLDLANARRRAIHGQLSMDDKQWRNLLKMALFYQRKTFVDGDVALVKEWPASNFILHEILGISETFRGIFLYGGLEDFLSSCLKIPYRRKLARARVTQMFAELKSMEALKEIDLSGLTDAQAAALHWLYLMYWHHDHAYQDHPRLRTLFSNDFFADPANVLQRSAKHFGIPLSDESARNITRGHVFNKHTKNPSKAFSIRAHEASLTAARRQFGDEVAAGVEWAQAITRQFPLPEHPGTSLLNL